MHVTLSPNLLIDEVWEFLAQNPTPEAVIAFEPSDALQERVRYLLESNREGILSPDEAAELDELSRINHFMRMLKIRAREKTHLVQV